MISFGGFARTFQVKPDLDKLRDRGISLGEFAEALEKGSSNAGGGYVERGQQQFLIRGVGLMRSPADIGNVVVAQRGARRSWCATWPASPIPACHGRAWSARTTTTMRCSAWC
jgi:Cu/Ag efflux pump CusA